MQTVYCFFPHPPLSHVLATIPKMYFIFFTFLDILENQREFAHHEYLNIYI